MSNEHFNYTNVVQKIVWNTLCNIVLKIKCVQTQSKNHNKMASITIEDNFIYKNSFSKLRTILCQVDFEKYMQNCILYFPLIKPCVQM